MPTWEAESDEGREQLAPAAAQQAVTVGVEALEALGPFCVRPVRFIVGRTPPYANLLHYESKMLRLSLDLNASDEAGGA